MSSRQRTSNKSENLYEVLGVSKTATPSEIKVAYFREAKKHHPDLNPGDKDATVRFQKLAAAYEILSDPVKRANYDQYGDSSETRTYSRQSSNNQQDNNQTSSTSSTHAEDVFNSVKEDMEIIAEVVQMYVEDMKVEIEYVVTSLRSGDYQPFWKLAKANGPLILAVVTPLVLFLRFPALVALALRGLWVVIPTVVIPIIRSGHAPRLISWMWKNIVNAADAKRKSKPKRK
jgi:hypothetical protein